MNPEIQQLNDRITKLEQIINEFYRPDRYVFERPISGGANGLKITSASTQKFGFHGVTPTIRNVFIVAPTGGATVDGPARGIINSIRQLLIDKGLMDPS